jgi:hypothetical protein
MVDPSVLKQSSFAMARVRTPALFLRCAWREARELPWHCLRSREEEREEEKEREEAAAAEEDKEAPLRGAEVLLQASLR